MCTPYHNEYTLPVPESFVEEYTPRKACPLPWRCSPPGRARRFGAGTDDLLISGDDESRLANCAAVLSAKQGLHSLGNHWYGYSAPRNLNIHDNADLLVPLLADRGLFAPMPNNSADFCVMASGGFSVSLAVPGDSIHPLYVLGLINTKLLF